MDAKVYEHPPDKITQILIKDLSGYQQLVELMHQERQLLVNREFDEFSKLLAKKHQLLLALEQNNNQRVLLLTAEALPVSKAGMDSLIGNLEESKREQHNHDWIEVNKLIDQCVQMNEINARIAHRAQSTTHQILNILRGDPAGFSLYGKKGIPAETSTLLPITKA